MDVFVLFLQLRQGLFNVVIGRLRQHGEVTHLGQLFVAQRLGIFQLGSEVLHLLLTRL